jgi:hypothetical protein
MQVVLYRKSRTHTNMQSAMIMTRWKMPRAATSSCGKVSCESPQTTLSRPPAQGPKARCGPFPLAAPPPLSSRHHHVDIAAAASCAHEPLSPIAHSRFGAVPLRLFDGIGLH